MSMETPEKLTIEVWSDIVCPFCYIGKRMLDLALEKFPHSRDTDIILRSFRLFPGFKASPGQDIYGELAKIKGQSREWSLSAHQQVSEYAATVGLEYNFDKAVMADTFHAHRLLHHAREKGLQRQTGEKLFSAYFTEGRNLNDKEALAQIGAEAGLDHADVKEVLASDRYAYEVEADEQQARELGIRGVPFFLAGRKLALSGAQGTAVMEGFLSEAWTQRKKDPLSL
jgi:predicted DsbA family dithiol-disulfide isomerase